MSKAYRLVHCMASGQMGGGLRHLQSLLHRLRASGIESEVVIGSDGPGATLLKNAGHQVRTLPLMAAAQTIPNIKRLAKDYFQALRHDDGVPTLFHAHGTRAGFLASWAKIAQGGPTALAYTNHGLACFKRGSLLSSLKNVGFYAAEALIYLHADAYLSVSDLQLSWLSRRLGPHSAPLFFPNTVDADAFHPVSAQHKVELRQRLGIPVEASVIACTARMVLGKGLDVVLAALKRMPEVYLLWIGDGPLMSYAQAEAVRLGIAHRCIWMGTVHEPGTVLPAADVFVLASQWEGEGIALLEAAACGLALVATATHGGQRMIQRLGGRCVPIDDSEGLADACRSLLASPQMREHLGAHAREEVLKHDDVPYRQLLDIYQRSLDLRLS